MAAQSSTDIDNGVGVAAVAEKVPVESAFMPGSTPSAAAPGRRPPGQAPGSAGHQACSSCSASGVTSAPSGSHARPTSITSRLGSETSASTVSRSGVTDHSSSSSRVSVSTGSSPTSTEPPAPSAQRPAHDATHGGAAAGQPAPVGGARHAQDRQRGAGVLAHQPQRPAHRLQLELEPAVARLVADEPRGEPVVRGRAAVLEGGDRLVGRLAACGGRLVLLLAPAARHLIRLPGAAGEDAGWVGHCVQ